LAQHPQAQVAAIADLDEARLAAVGEEFDIAQRFASPKDMLAAQRSMW